MPYFESFYIRNKGYNINIKRDLAKVQTWVLTNNNFHIKELTTSFHDNPTITPLNECQYILVWSWWWKVWKVIDYRILKLLRGCLCKIWFKKENRDVLPFIHWFIRMASKSEYETTTKPSYAIYDKLDFWWK